MAGSKFLYQNVLENAGTVLTATDEAGTNYIENILDKKSYTKWQASGAGTKTIVAELTSAVAVNAIGISGHNFNGLSITLEHYTSGSWVNIFTATVASANSYFKTFNSVSKSKFRLTIVGGSVTPECAIIYLGTYMEMNSYPEAPFAPYRQTVIADRTDSKGGHFLGAVIRSYPVTCTASFKYITTTVAAQLETFWQYARDLKPFYFAWASEASSIALFVSLRKESEFSLAYNTSIWIDGITFEMEGSL